MLEGLIKGMCFCYRTMVASAPLLSLAIPESEGKLKEYYIKHLEEEVGHELMLEDDLRRLGVEQIPYSHDAAKIAGAQYYFIVHDDPALLLGYMKALEQNPVTPEQVDELSKLCGTELTCMKHHAIHDREHKQDLQDMIDGLDPCLRLRVLWNERKTTQFLHEALDKLEKNHDSA